MKRKDPLNPLKTAVAAKLLPWFEQNRRDLPWRRKRTPYRVWVSELMLQQTRVDQVVGYFERFMKRFPSLPALARASRQEVLKAWEGLGYYARARHLHEAAIFLVKEKKGRIPGTREGLLSMPGVGAYTAAAIASLAYGRDEAVVDGNVIRVLSRLMAHGGDSRSPASRRLFQEWADLLLVRGSSAAFNEAMMELGATCCTPRKPLCARCPLHGECRAFAGGDPEAFPLKERRARVPHKVVGAGVIVDARGRLLVAQRKETAMLGGLWEFPGGSKEKGETLQQCVARELKEELGVDVEIGPRLTIVHHAYSHFTIELHAYWARIQSGRPRAIHCAAFAWSRLSALRARPFSRADLQIIEALEALGRPHRFPPRRRLPGKWSVSGKQTRGLPR